MFGCVGVYAVFDVCMLLVFVVLALDLFDLLLVGATVMGGVSQSNDKSQLFSILACHGHTSHRFCTRV